MDEDGINDRTFAVGEAITVNTFSGISFTYMAHTTDGIGGTGWVGQAFIAGAIRYVLFSNDGGVTGPVRTSATNFAVACFMAGTMIATPDGASAVETLKIGNLICTADGRAVSVKWIGRQTIAPFFGLHEGRRPVCIASGALGEDCPVRELRVTADHALLIDGVLVQAGALVNGGAIRRLTPAELGDRFTVFHVETENHEIILAEGAPAETFIDNVTRELFDNYAEFEALYGDTLGSMEELPHPRAKSFRQVPPSIRAKISERAAGVSRRLAGAA